MPAGTERIERFAVAEKDSRLVLLDYELGAQFYVGRPAWREPVNNLLPAIVEKLNDLYCHPGLSSCYVPVLSGDPDAAVHRPYTDPLSTFAYRSACSLARRLPFHGHAK
jgi:hypothetical protein